MIAKHWASAVRRHVRSTFTRRPTPLTVLDVLAPRQLDLGLLRLVVARGHMPRQRRA